MSNSEFVKICVALIMIFLHIVDDYYLQGILAKMKQKDWWIKNNPDKKYRFDYLVGLFMHAFSWTFMIMLPAMLNGYFPIWLFGLNVIIHSVVDDLKANQKKINLIVDQLIHIIQILITWFFCFIF